MEQTLPFRPAQSDGRVQVWLPDQNAKQRGACSMLNISECPNDAVASSLSQVLLKGGGAVDPAKVLFERQGLPRDSETGDVPRETTSAFAQSSFGAYRDASRAAGTLTASGGDMGGGQRIVNRIIGTLTARDYEKQFANNQSVDSGMLIVCKK